MKESINRYFKRILIAVPVVIVFLIIFQFVLITQFNSHLYTVKGADETGGTYMDLDIRKDSTSSWLKRDFSWEGEILDLSAQTIDGIFINNSNNLVDDWTMRIDITDDCFINNAWCGQMEIHQFVGTGKEKAQTLDLRNYELEDISLEYFYDGDLLIPLQAGDYIIYYPSVKDNEMPIEADSSLTMGCIFYYFDSLDFYDYQIDFTYHRSFTYGPLFYAILFLSAVWMTGVIIYVISLQFYKDAQKQLELKKSGLLCMSDIYFAIYMIDIKKNEIIPVLENDTKTITRPKEMGAMEQLTHLFTMDATAEYRQLTIDFCDITTLADRMKDKNSIAFEYLSKRLGWCSIRFFVQDRIEGRAPDHFLFTIQVIDSEKKEMKAIEEHITMVQQENMAGGEFLREISDEILDPLHQALELNDRIIAESRDDKITNYAKDLRRRGDKLSDIMHDLVDYSLIQTDRVHLSNRPFSMGDLLKDVKAFAQECMDDNKSIEMKFDIANTVPKTIRGDRKYLLRVLKAMISAAYERTEKGSIQLSVFGKAYESGVHLVFSVRNTGDGNDQSKDGTIGIRLCDEILRKMDSGLKLIASPQDGAEAYFEIETTAEGTDTLGDAGFKL